MWCFFITIKALLWQPIISWPWHHAFHYNIMESLKPWANIPMRKLQNRRAGNEKWWHSFDYLYYRWLVWTNEWRRTQWYGQKSPMAGLHYFIMMTVESCIIQGGKFRYYWIISVIFQGKQSLTAFFSCPDIWTGAEFNIQSWPILSLCAL